jgi:outer membrane protein TolC
MAGLDDLLAASKEDTRPATAPVELNPPTAADGGPWELPELLAVGVALKHRLDLRIAKGEVFDAQRKVTVAANALEAGLTLEGSARIGQSRSLTAAEQDNVKFNPEHGLYTAGLLLDLPLERTAERNAYRNSYITLAQAVRSFQELEDTIKLQVRNDLRDLVESRESFRIQALAVQLAERRVKSTELFLQAGRAEIRDVLEAQESLVTARNQRTAALVNYRITELQLQRDMGILNAQPDGLWTEVFPDE